MQTVDQKPRMVVLQLVYHKPQSDGFANGLPTTKNGGFAIGLPQTTNEGFQVVYLQPHHDM